MVAVTAQVVGELAAKVVPDTEHPKLLVAYDTAPSPDPPLAVSMIGVPATPVVKAFETMSDCWATPNENDFTEDVVDA